MNRLPQWLSSGPRRWRPRGQGVVWFAFVVLVLVLMVGVLADSAASAGAGVLDPAALRADPTGPPRLDLGQARATAAAYVTRHQPDAVPQVEAAPDHIVVRVTLSVPVVVVHAFGQDTRQVIAESEAHPMSGLAAPGP